MWTCFEDLYSGGGLKMPPYEEICIEAEREEAIEIFLNRFSHHPLTCGCQCCGVNYDIREATTLEELTACDRRCSLDETGQQYDLGTARMSIEEYQNQEFVLVIRAHEILPEERDPIA